MRKQEVTTINHVLNGCEALSDAVLAAFLMRSAKEFANKLGLPYHFVFFLLALEDKRFPKHRGIDLIAMLRAVLSNAARGTALQGASTITQQLYSVSKKREGVREQRGMIFKIKQASWAVRVEIKSSKSDILAGYIKNVYWGRSYYGISDASLGYFKVEELQLTVAQSFFLVERLATPNAMLKDRVIELLTRPLIWSLFESDASRFDELVRWYEIHFQGGEGLYRWRERSINTRDERTCSHLLAVLKHLLGDFGTSS